MTDTDRNIRNDRGVTHRQWGALRRWKDALRHQRTFGPPNQHRDMTLSAWAQYTLTLRKRTERARQRYAELIYGRNGDLENL